MPTSVSLDFKGTIQITFHSLRRENSLQDNNNNNINNNNNNNIAIQGAKEENRDLRK
jgi:hypothetical protein